MHPLKITLILFVNANLSDIIAPKDFNVATISNSPITSVV